MLTIGRSVSRKSCDVSSGIAADLWAADREDFDPVGRAQQITTARAHSRLEQQSVEMDTCSPSAPMAQI
jgi:hypothetical protein